MGTNPGRMLKTRLGSNPAFLAKVKKIKKKLKCVIILKKIVFFFIYKKKKIKMKNWKTTSSGILLIVGAIVAIVFSAIAGTITQGEIMTSVTAILAGIGLFFAKDEDSNTDAKV